MMDGIHSPCVPKTARPNHSFYVVLMNAWNILSREIILKLGFFSAVRKERNLKYLLKPKTNSVGNMTLVLT